MFTLTAYVGAPQIVLIGACVVAFGPEQGFWYSWVATIVSGAATYFTGRLTSAETQRRFGGATGGRFTRFMGKNGFLASLIVRFLPTAPFVVVNMAFGAARVSFWAYIGGLALGVLPKTAIVAFAGDGILDALEGRLGSAALMGVLAIVVWFSALFWCGVGFGGKGNFKIIASAARRARLAVLHPRLCARSFSVPSSPWPPAPARSIPTPAMAQIRSLARQAPACCPR